MPLHLQVKNLERSKADEDVPYTDLARHLQAALALSYGAGTRVLHHSTSGSLPGTAWARQDMQSVSAAAQAVQGESDDEQDLRIGGRRRRERR